MGVETGQINRILSATDAQNRLLAVIARGSEILVSGGRWAEGVKALVADLGHAIGVSRVWVCRNIEVVDNAVVQDAIFSWDAKSDFSLKGTSLFSRYKVDPGGSIGQSKVVQSRREGEFQKVTTRDLEPSNFRDLLELQQVVSMLSLPIFVQGEWWGTIGFDDCEREIDWETEHIALLQITAHLISDVIVQDRLTARDRQFDILQRMTGCSTWRFSFSSKKIWCTSEIFTPLASKTFNRYLSLREFLRLLHPICHKNFIPTIKELFISGKDEISLDVRVRTDSGSYRWVELRGAIDKSKDGVPRQFAGIALDITGRKEEENRLRHEAGTDPLTGVHNRRRIADVIQRLLGEGSDHQPFSLLFIDLDYFKKVNDQYGHEVGDQILRHFVHVCKGCLRFNDHLGRIGGEEFIIILPAADATASSEIAHRIRDKFENSPYKAGENLISTTVSIGVVTCENFNATQKELYKLADDALYAAKRAGRNNVVHQGVVGFESD